MMNKLLFILLVIVMSSHSAVGASYDEVQQMTEGQMRLFYNNFQKYVSDSDNYDDAEINRLISFGILRNDDEINRGILAGIAYEAYLNVSLKNELKRDISGIGNFKSWLISYIRAGLGDKSWIADKTVPPWWAGYIVLVTYFPNDIEVENLIFDSMVQLPENTSDFLQFFAIGKYESARIQQLRFSSIMLDDVATARNAVRGIRETLPPEGLSILGAALVRRDEVLLDIVEAIPAYGESSLSLLADVEILLNELKEYSGEWALSPQDIERVNNVYMLIKNYEVDLNIVPTD